MTEQELLHEIQLRTEINEGDKLKVYLDKNKIPTIAYGFNLTRPDAASRLAQVGVNSLGDVLEGKVSLTQTQASKLLSLDMPHFFHEARNSLPSGVFDKLNAPRQAVVFDLTYNMGPGEDGWGGFHETHALLQQAVSVPLLFAGANLFSQVGAHLLESKWYKDVGPNRAGRDITMMRLGIWTDPTGNGTL